MEHGYSAKRYSPCQASRASYFHWLVFFQFNNYVKFLHHFLIVEIAPVCVAPTTEPSHEGDELLATGWGWLSEGWQKNFYINKVICNYWISIIYASGEQTFAATLHKVIAPGISVSQCTATFGQLVSEASLCIDTTGPKGPCTVKGKRHVITPRLRSSVEIFYRIGGFRRAADIL